MRERRIDLQNRALEVGAEEPLYRMIDEMPVAVLVPDGTLKTFDAGSCPDDLECGRHEEEDHPDYEQRALGHEFPAGQFYTAETQSH